VTPLAVSIRNPQHAAIESDRQPMKDQVTAPAETRFATTAMFFIAGAVVTSLFSGSLAVLAKNASIREVLSVGMVVPSFTWVVQLTASFALMKSAECSLYWAELSWVCLLGSIALLPAAILNFCLSEPRLWLSAANVLISVAIMGATLYRRTTRQGISPAWPVSWVFTIAFNMTMFVWVSRAWWSVPRQ
jgi:hypothetical protein